MEIEASQSLEKANYKKQIKELYIEYQVNPEIGISNSQVQEYQQKYGINELKKIERSFWKVVVAPIINLLIIIYLISAFAMWILGEVVRTIPTFLIVGFNAVVAIVQQLRAEKQLQALQKLSEATTKVLRDGEIIEISNSDVVMGDIIKLDMGDKIPADCRIISARNLAVDESCLTGESEPAKKLTDASALIEPNLPLQKQHNMLFMGTFVASGNGQAMVVCIGDNTEIGKISTKLEATNTGDIPLRNKMNTIAKFLGVGVLILVTLSIAWRSIFLFKDDPFSWEIFKLALIESIDLGMKVMPINLPLLTTIVLLTGVLAMAQKGVIVRDISRTESLGRVSVLCTDKTGTLTQNQMMVKYIWTSQGEFSVEGSGYAPLGKIKPIVENDGEHQTKDLEALILSGYLNNNSNLISEKVTIIGRKEKEIKWTITGLPTEAALKVLGNKYNPNLSAIIKDYHLISEFSFDSNVKRMSQLYQKNEETLLFIKGATETLLSLSTQIQENGLLREILDEDKTRITKAMTTFASQGYRILSLGYRIIDSNLISMVGSDKDDVREIFEQDLIYIGFVVIYDPPRPDAYIGIQECRSAQIKTIMITGDNLITATAIATDLDIYRKEEDLAVEGNSIEILSNDDFQRVSVYARVSPEHKQIIVGRYQEMGKIVAMSGDGVNDALALSMADCGVAMGIQGTEVAKEAADMVITDDSFSTIVTGIREGRGLFEKIRTIIYFFVCVSVMEAIILFTSTLNPNNPFFQMWDFHQLNLLYITAHMFPSLGFTFGSYSKTIMNEPPRDSAEILTKNIMKIMLVQAVLMGLAIVISYYFSSFGFIKLNDVNAIYGPYHGINEILPLETQIKARTMAFVVLFLLESLLMPLQIRRLNDPLKKSLKDLDYWKEFLYYIPSMLILIIAIYSIPFQTFMGEKIGWNINLMYLSLSDWLICIGLSIPAFIVFELVRQYYWKKSVYF